MIMIFFQIMDEYGIHTVPIIYDYQKLPETIAEVVEMSKGISQLREGQKREGIVWRSEDCKISFKAINPEYLLSQEAN